MFTVSSEGRGYVCGGISGMQQKINVCFWEGGVKPKVLFIDKWNADLPGYEGVDISYCHPLSVLYSIMEQCGKEMPCHLLH
jgi:hypothetical protein